MAPSMSKIRDMCSCSNGCARKLEVLAQKRGVIDVRNGRETRAYNLKLKRQQKMRPSTVESFEKFRESHKTRKPGMKQD